MNYDSNCLPTHFIIQIWPPATFICSQILRDGSRDTDFHQIKRFNGKQIAISEALINRITREASKCWKIVSSPEKIMLYGSFHFKLTVDVYLENNCSHEKFSRLRKLGFWLFFREIVAKKLFKYFLTYKSEEINAKSFFFQI